jgi:hypothetical protein
MYLLISVFMKGPTMRRTATALLCTPLLLTAFLVGSGPRPAAAAAQSSVAVVNSLFTILNEMSLGKPHADLSTVYAPNVTFTLATPLGVRTVIHGLTALKTWETKWATTNAGVQLTTTRETSPSPDYVIHYENAGSAVKPLIAKCAHFLSVDQGKIISDDWVTYYVAK